MEFNKSKKAYEEACRYIPGGVNSPVRAFNSVGTSPVFIKSANGSTIIDEDDNKYIDYICSWGPMIYGHGNEKILEGIDEAIKRGMSYGLGTSIELEMAKLISEIYPAAEKVRMVNSGTEATMSAIRVARGYTGRDKIIKFEGCYHGHSDGLLVKTGSGALTFKMPTSPGVPEDIIKNTLVARYNDLDSVKKLFEENKDEIACVIVEPIAGNMGLVPGKAEFLEGLREITKENGTVLIFDEVISGFRASIAGASKLYEITPDMACFGKIIGGGLPVAAYAGKSEIMDMVSPEGPVYQAGTLSGNPVGMYVGRNTLNLLKEDTTLYNRLEEKTRKLADGIRDNIKKLGIKASVNQLGSLMTLFFGETDVDSYEKVMNCDTKTYAKYFNEMLHQGIMLPPAQYECMFISDALTDEEIEYTIKANYKALEKLV